MNPFGIQAFRSKRTTNYDWAIAAIGVVGLVVIFLTR